ncbi:hypothetical protein [Nocardia sp. NPDC060259]|uniref:hypothetical protein n=1 Tax=Nocardia sp. NPDC060259 TaxID=3347088 RepID=UPI0036460D5C
MPSVEKRAYGPALVALVLVALGIAVYVADRKPPRVRADPTATHVWSGASGIELGSRSSELVRATVESAEIAQSAGLNFTYPGFREAWVGEPQRWDSGISDGSDGDYEWWLQSGRYTYRDHIARMVENDGHVEAKVCQYEVPDVGENWTAGQFAGNFRVYAVKLENLKSGRDLDRGGGTVAGGRRTPDRNVFGDWRITELTVAYEWEPHDCRSWFSTQATGLEFRFDKSPAISTKDTVVPYGPIQSQYPMW